MIGLLELARVFELQVIGRCPENVGPKRLVIVASHIATDFIVIVVAFALIALRRRQLDAYIVTQTKVKNSIHVVGVVLLVARANLAAELTSGLAARNIDNATNGVAAKQCALRPPEYFHTFYIDTAKQTAGIRANKHAIDDNTNSRVEVFLNVGNAHTTNKYRGNAARPLSGIVNNNVR